MQVLNLMKTILISAKDAFAGFKGLWVNIHFMQCSFCSVCFFLKYTITVSVSCLNDSHLLVLIQNSWTSNFTAEISSVKM